MSSFIPRPPYEKQALIFAHHSADSSLPERQHGKPREPAARQMLSHEWTTWACGCKHHKIPKSRARYTACKQGLAHFFLALPGAVD